MRDGFAESDWKLLRKLHPIALDRFCRRVLEEIERVAVDASQSHHGRYVAIYRLVQRRDRELAGAFNDMRRSMAVIRICYMRRLGLFTDEEFGRFGEQTRSTVQGMLEFAKGKRAAPYSGDG